MATIGQQKRNNWLGIWLIALLAAAFMAVLVWLVFFRAAPRSFAIPGSGGASAREAEMTVSRGVTEALHARLTANLQSQAGLASGYIQENREKAIPASRSTLYKAKDQLRYGSWLVEQGDRAAFFAWLQTFQAGFASPEGLVYPERQSNPSPDGNFQLSPVEPSQVSWPDSLLYLRVLAQGYSSWPERKLDRTEKKTASALALVMKDQLAADSHMPIPTAAPTLDPAERPPETIETEPLSNLPQEAVVSLETLDLAAFQQLAILDSSMKVRSEEAEKIAQGGFISDTLPLYAATWYPDRQGYVRFEGSQPVIDLAASLNVALHLAEVGKLDPRTVSWLSEHLMNDGALYTTYHIAQGQPTTPEESLASYALVARIARTLGDKALYDRAVSRLQWHLATSQTSQVRDAIFRQDGKDVIQMTAEDNIWALLAFS